MAGSIYHSFTNPQADVTQTDIVRPSDWNSIHIYTLQDAASLSGNTAGVLANISSGTLYLAGGNNVTLSQDGNSVTISGANSGTAPPIGTAVKEVMSALSTGTITRFAAEDHAHRGVNLVQISGNTSNTSNVVYGSLYLAGGNNVTLSQVSAAGAATISISAANETQTVPPIATAVNNVATADSVGTITRFAPEDHRHRGLNQFQISGNTSNSSNAVFGSLVLAGGNNITLSQVTGAGIATVTISAANETQTVPPIATAVKVEVSTVASTGTITRFSPEDHMHKGINSAGVTNAGNSLGNTGVIPGRFVMAGGNNVTLSVGTDATGQTVTVQAGGTLSFFDPFAGAGFANIGAGFGQSLMFVNPIMMDEFGSFSAMNIMFQALYTTTGSSHTLRNTVHVYAGIYTKNGSTLSLASSGSLSTNWTVSSNDSTNAIAGPKLMKVAFNMSMTPGNYWVGIGSSTSSSRQAGGANSFAIFNIGPAANNFSGVLGAASDNSVAPGPGMGFFSASTSLPPSTANFVDVQGLGGARAGNYFNLANFST